MADGTSKRVGLAGDAWRSCDVAGRGLFRGRAGAPAGDSVKQTQFAGGQNAPRRHGEQRDGYKCNWYNDLGRTPCVLCASVVDNRSGEVSRGNSGPDFVKQTQFAAGVDLLRRHAGHGGEGKCNSYNDLGFVLCGLRVSVVNNGAGEMSRRGAGPKFAKQTQFAVGGLEFMTQVCETDPIWGGPASACASLRRAGRRGLAFCEEKN